MECTVILTYSNGCVESINKTIDEVRIVTLAIEELNKFRNYRKLVRVDITYLAGTDTKKIVTITVLA